MEGNVFSIDPNTSRIGIACTSPQYRLHVVGDVGIQGNIYATTATINSGVTACSDIRYKRNIRPISKALEKVMDIKGVLYEWKRNEFPEKDFPEGTQIGVIAQDLEKVYPELVKTDEKGYKSVDYSRLTPILVEAIKEQQQIIEHQKEEIVNLKQHLSLLMNQVSRINAQLGITAEKK